MFDYEDSLQFQSECIKITFYLYNILESAFTVNEEG